MTLDPVERFPDLDLPHHTAPDRGGPVSSCP
ncbi:hypothetical protein BH20ACT18_BH20ACT18_09750 [soil metagenome]